MDFYSKLLGATPQVVKEDYAKWMLDDPRINLAISTRSDEIGVNNLGFQVEGTEDLHALREKAEAAQLSAIDDAGATCCYALSDKYWIQDPSGVPWEVFHTLKEIPVFGDTAKAPEACCAPKAGRSE